MKAKAERQKVRVVRVKGDRRAARTIESMLAKGWQLQNESARKAVFSPLTGFFTRKQIHTLTFVREAKQPFSSP